MEPPVAVATGGFVRSVTHVAKASTKCSNMRKISGRGSHDCNGSGAHLAMQRPYTPCGPYRAALVHHTREDAMRVSFSRLLPLVLSAAVISSACSNDDAVSPTPSSVAVQLGQANATITRGGTITVPITLSRTNYAGTVNLVAEGLPAGVTATFNPVSVAGSSTTSNVTIAATSTATTGAANITIRASGSGITTSTVTLPLTVNSSAGVTLGTTATTAAAAQGALASLPVFITRTGDFTGDVTLTAEGLPTGVTATFAPATIASGSRISTLTLTTAANATAGVTPITIRAAGTGVTAQTQVVNFTIAPSTTAGFYANATPAALVIAPGASGTTTLNITRQSAFAGGVQFVLEGAPAGVTATFNPNPATAGASTVTIAATAAVTPGTYQLMLKGTSAGATDRSIPITLIVQ